MKKAPGRGGKRLGSGRKATYGSPMAKRMFVRFSDEQASAVSDYCRQHRYPAAALIREVSLEAAGFKQLGTGLQTSAGEVAGIAAGSGYPVKMTAEQNEALLAFCGKNRITMSAFAREATLLKIGRRDLGASGQLADLERVVGAAAARVGRRK